MVIIKNSKASLIERVNISIFIITIVDYKFEKKIKTSVTSSKIQSAENENPCFPSSTSVFF